MRAATLLLLALATMDIAYADLLRPCQCGPDNPLSCGSCPASKAASAPTPAPC